MWTGTQWTDSLDGHSSATWFTFGWPASWHIVWYVMAVSPQVGGPQLDWDVAVERANASDCTYWITVTNLTGNPVTLEGRFAVLS